MIRVQRGLRRTLTHNLGWKLASGVTAVALWMVFAPRVATIPARVRVQNVPAELRLESVTPDNVQLRVRHTAPVPDAHRVVTLDLAEAQAPGEMGMAIGPKNVDLPEGFSFISSAPNRVVLVFSRRADSEVRGDPHTHE